MLEQLTPTDMRSLHVFRTIAEHGGFARAQEKLGIGQSTISLQLSGLEKRLGYRLCDRGRSGFRLTERGRSVLDAIFKLEHATDLFTETVAHLSQRIVGKFKLGLLDHTATDDTFSTVELIRSFKRRAPDVEIEIVQNVQSELQGMIVDRQLDLAIGAFPPVEKPCRGLSLYIENQYIYCGREHSLFDVDVAEIDRINLESAQWVRQGFTRPPRNGFPLCVKDTPATAANLEAVATLLQAAPLLGYLPSHFAKRFIENRTLYRLTSRYSIEYDIILLARSGRRETAAMKVFRQLAVNQAKTRQRVEARTIDLCGT